jgi:hypothetical protein
MTKGFRLQSSSEIGQVEGQGIRVPQLHLGTGGIARQLLQTFLNRLRNCQTYHSVNAMKSEPGPP